MADSATGFAKYNSAEYPAKSTERGRYTPRITVTQRRPLEEQFKHPSSRHRSIKLCENPRRERSNEEGGNLHAWGYSVLSETATEIVMQSLEKVRVTMDMFQHRYYKVNKIVMTIIGQWPYQAIGVRCGIIAVLSLLSISQAIPQTVIFINQHDDWEFLLDCIVATIFHAASILKFLLCLWNSQKMLKLLNYIRSDWKMWAPYREVNILHKYAQRGREMTIAYAGSIIISVQPMISKIIDIFLKNDSTPGQFPIPVDYYPLDMEKYYFYISAHCFVCACGALLVHISCDVMLIVYVQHCCGVFAALGHKLLQRNGKNETSAETDKAVYSLNRRDIDFEHLVSCIGIHNHAIESADLVEATYTWYFFFFVGLNMFVISMTGFQKSGDHDGIRITFIVYNLGAIMHLYCESYMCQIFEDHSTSMNYYLLNVEWYSLSLRAQKLLLFMIMRCNKPCILTAGKMYAMSMKTFATILKTSLSYFTLLRSI